MVRWKQFGEQVNCLIYSLAGQKYQGDIELTNRKVAEQIHYSEASLRAMRQGRFRPQDDSALATLVEIGCRQAGLNRAWAETLLHHGRHPNPKNVLSQINCTENSPTVSAPKPEVQPALNRIIPRTGWMAICTLLCMFVWVYFISPDYPAPHELSIVYEMTWAALIGCGLAGGLLLADARSTGRQNLRLTLQQHWTLLLIPIGGLLGAVLWNTLLAAIFASNHSPQLQSTALETFAFGVVYGVCFSQPYLLISYLLRKQIITQRLITIWLFFPLLIGLLNLGGYALANLQPAFANQKDIDLLIGLLLRASLILGMTILSPMPAYGE
ncbi:MAG: hypothetical protein CVU39_14400 [Chloroflexi bacterium HGW-Chloroflexi-10]|nr:MAG: hypothetical protein CVU39_14400 [Chloroflexi bacterium HGW-Chloroflexi-10]